jgi:hypothetical protein
MKIDIDTLTEAELVDLNNRIVERLRLLQQMRAHAQNGGRHADSLQQKDRYRHHRQRRALERRAQSPPPGPRLPRRHRSSSYRVSSAVKRALTTS